MPVTREEKVCPVEIASDGMQLGGNQDTATPVFHCSVAHWFSQQAANTPDCPAIVQEGEVLTYSDLDLKSNHLAHWLRASGVQAETVVALSVSRSFNFIIGALGIWKAGGAYLPLDPDMPLSRTLSLLDDAKAAIVLTERRLHRRELEENRYVMDLDAESHQLSILPATPPIADGPTGGDDLAYVIYTSGSTGLPKGVEITHRNLLNLIEWHQQAFSVTPIDRATQLANLGFDAAVWELWPYLTAGASVHLVPDGVRTMPVPLRDWLVENEITITFAPTPLAESLFDLDWPSNTALRLMLTGADVLHRHPPARLPFQLVNNYGPTECTVVTTSGIVPPGSQSEVPPSIGQAISNVRLHILGENMEPVRPGTPGELYISGAGVARGYRNRPDLTAERFLTNPLRTAEHERLYRSGDLVCALPDGQLAFIGRSDEQIKIAGYRIEPNEVVHAIGKHASIQTSCVICREEPPGTKKLLAYIVLAPEAQLSNTKLRQFLQQLIPAYMIPAEFIVLPELPLTSSGKIDRALLPPADSSNVLRDAAFVAPRNIIEARLTEILSGLLSISRVSVEDNFFMLGGHSLLGTQLIGRVRDAFGVELSLRTIFDSSTIAQLSVEIEKLLIRQIEALTEAEVQRLLETQESGQTPGTTDALQT